MTGETHLKTLGQVQAHAPLILHSNAAPRPGIEILRYILAEEEGRIEEDHDASRECLAERPQLHRSRDHVARKRAALRVLASVLPSIGGAQVGINFVMRRSKVKLRPAPVPVLGKE